MLQSVVVYLRRIGVEEISLFHLIPSASSYAYIVRVRKRVKRII
jgi:hypothetical protein